MTLDAQLCEALSRFAPPETMQAVETQEGMTVLVQHLNSLYKAIASFLPLYVAENEDAIGQRYQALRPGTFLFADVSGFTALSERLQQESSADGAENLTLIMNDYFATMLEILAKSDGQLLKFAGDALLAFFPAGRGDANDISDALKAARTGIRMQRAMRRFQPVSTPQVVELLRGRESSLTMSIGLARGKMFESLVGNVVQREHVVQGTLPDRAMDAEAVGERDEVIVEQALADLLGTHFTLKPLSDGFVQIVDDMADTLDDYEFDMLRRRRAKSTAAFLERENMSDHLRQQVERLQEISRYVSPAVMNQLIVSEDYHLRSENRYTVTMFLHAYGFAELLEAWGEEHLEDVTLMLERYYAMVHQVATTSGGMLTRTDPYKLGVKILITFGALVAHADDSSRAADAALELNRQLERLNIALMAELPPPLRTAPIQHQIGITQGHTFSGEVGWKARREYTVMGDEVNLAARLMAKAAAGQILLSERVYRRIHADFKTEAVEPLRLKGKSQLIQAYQLLSETQVGGQPNIAADALPFIGHDLFLLSLSYALRQVLGARRRRAVALVGNVGTGKTRIAGQLAANARELGFQIAWATCRARPNRKATWASLITQILGIETALPDDMEAQQMHLRLKEMGAEAHSEGLLALCYGRPTGAEAEKAGGALAGFLQAYTDQTPLLVVIDDVHFAQPLMLDMLRQVLETLRRARLMILVTQDPFSLVELDVQTLLAPDLSEQETHAMAIALLDTCELGGRLHGLLWQRTGGRPQFIESYLRSLDEHGYIARTEWSAELTPNADVDIMPDDVRDLVISRFDRLTSNAQELLRAASVLGERFSEGTLAAVCSWEGSASEIEERLARTLEEVIRVQIIEPRGTGWYGFRYGLTQRAVYESLTRLHRQEILRAAAATH